MTEDPFDPLEPYRRAEHEFRRSLEASAERFQARLRRASAKVQAANERAKHEMSRAKEQYEAEVTRVRARFHGGAPTPENERLDAYDEFLAAKAEFEAELSRSLHALSQERRNKEYQRRRRNGRRGRGLDDGGEPAPVEPRPNPTPLVDGAEAPID